MPGRARSPPRHCEPIGGHPGSDHGRGHVRRAGAAGADSSLVAVADAHDKTPLHLAAEHDRAEIAALLLEAGADIEARATWGATPLDWAGRARDRGVGEGPACARGGASDGRGARAGHAADGISARRSCSPAAPPASRGPCWSGARHRRPRRVVRRTALHFGGDRRPHRDGGVPARAGRGPHAARRGVRLRRARVGARKRRPTWRSRCWPRVGAARSERARAVTSTAGRGMSTRRRARPPIRVSGCSASFRPMA